MNESKARVAYVSDDDFTVALNIGSNAGVQENDLYLVYSYSDKPIIDPDTKESLGKLEIVKGKGKVVNVQENLCTIRSTEKHYVKRHTLDDGGIFKTLAGSRVLTYDDTEEIPFDAPKVGDYAKKI